MQDVVIQVVRKMRHEKLLNIIRILSMLSFFLDQVMFLFNTNTIVAAAATTAAAPTTDTPTTTTAAAAAAAAAANCY